MARQVESKHDIFCHVYEAEDQAGRRIKLESRNSGLIGLRIGIGREDLELRAPADPRSLAEQPATSVKLFEAIISWNLESASFSKGRRKGRSDARVRPISAKSHYRLSPSVLDEKPRVRSASPASIASRQGITHPRWARFPTAVRTGADRSGAPSVRRHPLGRAGRRELGAVPNRMRNALAK